MGVRVLHRKAARKARMALVNCIMLLLFLVCLLHPNTALNHFYHVRTVIIQNIDYTFNIFLCVTIPYVHFMLLFRYRRTNLTKITAPDFA